MKKRIVCMLLALLLLVGMLPVGVFAEGKTEYEKNETGTAVFNSVLSGQIAYVSDDPTLGWNSSTDYTITVDKALLSQTFTIADSYVGESGYWYKLAPIGEEAMPAKLSAKPWVYQNDIPTGGYEDALIITPPANTCRCCESCTGAEDCECGCGECDYCEPVTTDPTTPTDPSQPECGCCENCANAEGCTCGCENCQFCEPEVPADPEIPTVTDETTGAKVYAETLPEGVTLDVDTDVDGSALLSDFRLSDAQLVFAWDISLRNADNTEYQPGSGAMVKIPVNAAAGTKIGLLHKHSGGTSFMGVTEVLSDGTIEFYTDSFSEFAGFTVDFHYQETDVSMEGLTSVGLADLFSALGINEDASKAKSVVFSDPSLVEVTQVDDNWLLTSKAAFTSEETLIITFDDGHTVVIDVTDEQLVDKPGDSSSYWVYRLFEDRSDFYFEYNSITKDGGLCTVNYHYYNNDQKNELDSDAGTKHFGWTSGDGMGQTLTYYSSSSWCYIYKTNRVYMNMDGKGRRSCEIGKSSLVLRADLYFTTYPTAITLTKASGSPIDPNTLCTVSIDSRMATSTETRNVAVYYNGVLAGEAKNVLFPNRNNTADGYDQTNGINATQKNSSRYRANTYNVHGANVIYQYNSSTKTYNLYFYDYAYKLNYNVNNGSGSIASTVISANSASSYNVPVTSSEPTRDGYRFLGWADSASATTAKYTAGGTVPITGTQSSNGSTITAEKTVYAVWKEIPSVTIHHYLQGTTTKVAEDTVEALPYNKVVTVADYIKSITNHEYVSCSSATLTVGETAAANTAIIYYKNVSKHTVTWKNWDGTVLKTDIVAHGSNVTYSGTTPTKSVDGYISSFTGWDQGTNGTISNVTATMVVTAQFDTDPISYTITFDTKGATSGDIADKTLTWDEQYTLPTPEKKYTVTYDHNYAVSGTQVKTSDTAQATFLGWEDQGSIVCEGTTWNYTDFDAPFYGKNSPDVVASSGFGNGIFNKYALLKHYILHGKGEYESDPVNNIGRKPVSGVENVWGAYAGGTLVSNLSTTDGDTVLLVATWSEMSSVTLPTPTRTGYTFGGWYTDAACTEANKVTDTTITPESNVTLYAKWTPDTREVTYKYEGTVPSGAPAVPAKANVMPGTSTKVAEVPSLAGYTFSGWNTSDATVSKGSFTMPDKAVTFTGDWSENTYNISYDLDEGELDENDENPATYQADSANFTLHNPKKDGYEFTGWTESISTTNWTNGFINLDTGACETYNAGYPNSVYSEKIFLEAGVTYKLEGTNLNGIRWRYFDTNGNFLGNKSLDDTFTPDVDGYVQILLYEGCTEANRNAAKITSSQGTTVLVKTGSTGDRAYTANWSVNTYTITYNHNDVTSGDPTITTDTYTIEEALTLAEAPTREGYKFTGWELEKAVTEPVGNWDADTYSAAQTFEKGKYGNITLVAQWEEQYRYVLNFDANGGIGAPASITEEWCDDKEYTFTWTEVPTRTGYTFMGWAENAASEENVAGADKNSIKLDGEAAETVTKTIFAIWKRDTGTIQLNYSGGVPVVVTVTCTDAVNDEEKITINTVVTSNTTIKDLPTGTYKVTAESGNANYTAYVNPGSTLLKSGETANFDLSVSDEGFNWLTGFAHVINKRGG